MFSFQPSYASIWRLYKHGRTCMPSLFNSSFYHLCLPTVNPMHKMDDDQLVNRSSLVRIKFLPYYSRISCASLLQYSTKSDDHSIASYKKRVGKRLKLARKASLDKVRFNKAVSCLPARFTAVDLHDVLAEEDDPVVCLELFNWASKQRRFEHDVSTVHKTIEKLGIAGMLEEIYDIVDQILTLPNFGSEALYHTIIYYYIRARKFRRALTVFRHMKTVKNSVCKPTIRTYNLFFGVCLPRGSNTYINYMYMDTMETLFREMIQGGVEPDTLTLNLMILGYVKSNHVNVALRIFHKMGVVYSALPDSFTYDHLIYGLCAQSRTRNASDLFNEMKGKGFIACAKTYNSLVNAFAIGGEVDQALKCFWEMTEKQHPADFITYKTLLDEFCREGRTGEALNLVKELKEKNLVDEPTYEKLLLVVKDDFRGTCS